MRNAHCRIWIMARKLTNEENEKLSGRTWNMARNTEKCAKCEKHTLQLGIWRENMKKKYRSTLQYLAYGEKTEKCGK